MKIPINFNGKIYEIEVEKTPIVGRGHSYSFTNGDLQACMNMFGVTDYRKLRLEGRPVRSAFRWREGNAVVLQA